MTFKADKVKFKLHADNNAAGTPTPATDGGELAIIGTKAAAKLKRYDGTNWVEVGPTITGTSDQITITTANTGSHTVSLPSSIIAPGDVTVTGNLTVSGTTTTINTAEMTVDDPNITINAVSLPSDTNANGGGITLKGASDYTIQWLNTDDRWHFNQGIEIDAGNLIVEAGNVGIGTAAPAQKLTVDSGNIQLTNGYQIQWGDTDTAIFGHATSDYISFKTAGTDRVKIDSSGQLGIGTTSPIAKLDVAGKIAISAESGTPSQPANGKGYLYSKSNGKLYWRSYDLSETELTQAGGGGGSGTVTSIAAGTGISTGGSAITTNGTIALDATISDLTNVSATGAQTGATLYYNNGNQWVHQNPSNGGNNGQIMMNMMYHYPFLNRSTIDTEMNASNSQLIDGNSKWTYDVVSGTAWSGTTGNSYATIAQYAIIQEAFINYHDHIDAGSTQRVFKIKPASWYATQGAQVRVTNANTHAQTTAFKIQKENNSDADFAYPTVNNLAATASEIEIDRGQTAIFTKSTTLPANGNAVTKWVVTIE